ncbi:MAG: glutamate racemase [Chthoniobacteraceae bacterium]|nr:glutamate racemase [Chthoniobacteraceae bacterium]
MDSSIPARPIGVFDSGIGGLTVTAELRRLLPHETIFYIGDTARVPYGGKSPATIERYSLEISDMLLTAGAKMIVVACNTASALAVPKLEETLPVPVTGVILPGARAAVATTRNGRVGVIGTRGTIRSGAYERAIHALAPEVRVVSQACPMLVPAIEEGWLEDGITDGIIARYLENLAGSGIDTLVLGCTHYPLVKAALARFLGPGIRLVDSAENCAIAVRELLDVHGIGAPDSGKGRLRVALTDASDGFLPVAEKALGLEVGEIHLAAVQR